MVHAWYKPGASRGNSRGLGGIECVRWRLSLVEPVEVRGERGPVWVRRLSSALPVRRAFRFALAVLPRAGTIPNVSHLEKPDSALPARGQRRVFSSLA